MQWLRSMSWLGTLAVASVAIAFGSAALQRAEWAPLLLSSLLIGAALGTAAIGAAWAFHVENGRLLVAGTVTAAILLVAAQHFALYRLYVNGWEQAQQEQPELALFREPPPKSLRIYLREEAADGRAWLWILDGAIVTATAAGIAIGLRGCCRKGNMD